MIAVVDDHERVVSELPSQRLEEERGIDPVALAGEPLLAVRLLVGGNARLLLAAPLRPLDAALGEAGEKARHDCARVARDRDLRGEVRAENVPGRCRRGSGSRGPCSRSSPSGSRRIAFRSRAGSRSRRTRSRRRAPRRREKPMPACRGCVGGKRRKALQRRRDRRPEALGDARDVVRDVHGAPAHEDAGRTRLREEVDRLVEKTRLRRLRRRGRLEDGQLVDRLLEELEVDRDLDEDRTGHARHGRAVRLEDRGHDLGVRLRAPRRPSSGPSRSHAGRARAAGSGRGRRCGCRPRSRAWGSRRGRPRRCRSSRA